MQRAFRSLRSFACVFAVLVACGDDGGTSEDGTTSSGATMSATVAPETSTDASAGTSSATESSTGVATSDGSTTSGVTLDPDTGTGTGTTDDSGSDTAGTTGDPLGDCCTAHGTPGCSVPEIQDCVCLIDAPCCVGMWDNVCVGEVEKQRCADCTP